MSAAIKPCEYCGTVLPVGIDKRTRQQRSHHFSVCDKLPAREPIVEAQARHQPFMAMAQGKFDYSVEVIHQDIAPYGPLMVVCATEEAVYITKQQAMDFFCLVDKESQS